MLEDLAPALPAWPVAMPRVRPVVLVVEDDVELRGLVARGLDEEGFDVHRAATGAEALSHVEDWSPDVVVLDIGLPDADGRDVCQAMRARGVRAPVVFLTALGALTDRLAGFNAGGDDYVAKPFAFAELVVRVRALARRGASGDASASATDSDAGTLRLDPAGHAVVAGERRRALTPTEFRLLATLVARRGDAVRRRELVAAAWPEGAIVHENTLDAYLARLRRKLRELGALHDITTLRGVGYRLE